MSDSVVSMTITKAEDATQASESNETLFTVCQNGYGKRTLVGEYRRQSRGGKGVIDIQTEGRNGPVVSAHFIKNDGQAMIITSAGKVIRINSSDISVIGRNTKGVRLINLDEGEVVSAVAPIAEKDTDTEGAGE
jgi:DNA gyrase subunit A